ncbi:endolytic transglycosylase MltG [Phosphitispora sp. TUW77]|uniref:endolytic transglycosylase MltG n=1 Tax=Phosphitispora sp. TUW77 TaxID=3152361 RepID=UPI003AB2E7C5
MKRKIFTILIILGLILSAGLLFVYNWFNEMLQPPADSGISSEKIVLVPKGTSTAGIANILKEQGLIRSSGAFRVYTYYRGLESSLQAGEFSLKTGMTVPDIVNLLAYGETVSLTFTIPEGYNLTQIADRLAEMKLADRNRFLKAAETADFDYDFLKGIPKGPGRLEGYLFPDTYRITKDKTEKEIIAMMLKRFSREITPEFKANAAKVGLTIHEAVIMASIIEREAQKDEERPKVSAVFLNRLNKGWKLESCATVQYALGKQKARLLNKDLEVDSPYNTYKYYGLPPGPIASPGSASLKAAVSPADVGFMFFVVSEDGRHVFSRTLNEHNRNKALYLNSIKTP